MSKLWLAGVLLIGGPAITLGLHALEAPEHLYRWLYEHLLSGLDCRRIHRSGAST